MTFPSLTTSISSSISPQTISITPQTSPISAHNHDVAVLIYPSKFPQHIAFEVGEELTHWGWWGHSTEKMSDAWARALKDSRACFIRFKIEVSPEEFERLKQLGPDHVDKARSCAEYATKALTEKTSFKIPERIGYYPFLTSTYLTAIRFTGHHVKSIEKVGQLTLKDAGSTALSTIGEPTALMYNVAIDTLKIGKDQFSRIKEACEGAFSFMRDLNHISPHFP